jgi:hypothetical protein
METKNESFDTFVSRVVKEAKRQSKYKSICVDNLRQFYPNQFNKAVEYAICNTAYWEGDF